MSRLDYLVRKLNIHGVTPRDVPGGGDGAAVTTEDVYAGMAFGKLAPEAFSVGETVYRPGDEVAFYSALAFATAAARQMFASEEWSAKKAYQRRLNDSVRDGRLTRSAAEQQKREYARNLPEWMALLALNELVQDDICRRCKGTGYIDGRLHPKCGGTGRIGHSEEYRAQFCYIKYTAWMTTWRHRYRDIRNLLRSWLNAYEAHLVEKC